jgi:hypothetical protein
MLSNGRTSVTIGSSSISEPSQAHYPMESQHFVPTPLCPVCDYLVAGSPTTTCGHCGLIVCQEEEKDCGKWLETLSSDSNDLEFAYRDLYYYCHICVPRVKREQLVYYPGVPFTQYEGCDTPVEYLLATDCRVSARANIKPTVTKEYIAGVRISHENAGVPPGSVFEEGRRLFMGGRYPEVLDSWEDRSRDSSSATTIATRGSTQAGEATVEVATGKIAGTQVQPPVSINVTSQSPPKQTKSTGSFRQKSLENFLPLLGHTPSLAKKSHPSDTSPPQPPLRRHNAVNL